MNYWFLLSGICLTPIVAYDFAYTALSANGVGILTGKISRGIWKVFLLLCNHRGAHPFFKHAGMFTVVANLVTWVSLAWLATWLIFMSDAHSIVQTTTGAFANPYEKVYFVGYTLSTAGYGDFQGRTDFWKIYSSMVSLSGLAIMTIGITYLVQVLTAEIDKRQLSLFIATLGGTPQRILLNGWNGRNFNKLERDFEGLASKVLAHSQSHLAYPILHHFHSSDIKESAAINLTALDEALTILLLCVPAEVCTELDLGSLRKALTTYLLTLESDFIEPSDQALPLPDLKPLQEEGIPLVVDEKVLEMGFRRLHKRRRLLRALLENDGWKWGDLNRPKFHSELDL